MLGLDLGDDLDVLLDAGAAQLGGEQLVDLEQPGRVVHLDLDPHRLSSPGSIETASIAAADTEWMFGRRVSNGTRERPLAMSSASATRTIPAST